MPRDKEGWRVAPAPDGRGMPEEHKPPPPHRMRGFWILVVALLAVNWIFVLAFQPSSGEPRVKVPFSPYFLNQVQAGQVKSISSKGNTVQGTFTTKLRYPDFAIRSRSTTLRAGVDDAETIGALACRLLDRALSERPGALRLVGVGVSGLDTFQQLTLV